MKLSQRAILYTLIGITFYLFLKGYFSSIKTFLDAYTQNGLLSYILTYLIIGLPIFLATYLIKPKENIFKNLGLGHQPFKALLISFIFASPMLIGGLLFSGYQLNKSIPNLIAGTIIAGFIEELYFRGFLFGQFYKHTRMGFIVAVLLGAVLFASGHLYQSQNPAEMFGIFGITFMGAVLFAWLYVEWNFNLWVPIFLHTLMNLAWHICDMDNTALGGVLPNVLRALTIAFAIIGTIMYKKKNNLEISITKRNLIWKNLSAKINQ